MDLTSDEAAGLLGITGGALRQIETNIKPVSLALAVRAADLYQVPVKDLVELTQPVLTSPRTEWVAYAICQGADPAVAESATKAHLIDLYAEDDKPEKPKPEKKVEPKVEPTSPPGRRNGRDDKKGPRRNSEARVA